MKVCNARRSDGHNFVPGHGTRLFCRGVICKGKIPLEASMKLRLWVWILVVASVAAWPVVGAPAADTNVVIQDAAGMKFANPDTVRRTAMAATHDTGSAAPTPYNASAIARAATIASRHPAIRPAAATPNP